MTDENDRIIGVVSGDIQLEELLKRAGAIQQEAQDGDEDACGEEMA